MKSRMIGKVKRFSTEKGYGFIESEDVRYSLNTTEDIFVHYSDIVYEGYKTLMLGDTVEFNVEEREKGLIAKKVKLVNRIKEVNKNDYTNDNYNS